MAKGLLISVGTSPEPICKSIESLKPEYVIYYSSQQTRSVIREKIEPALQHKPKDHEIIVTANEEDLVSCVKELLREVPAKLQLWNLEYADIVGHYTGGTKSMSVGLVLALLGKGSTYGYVGGDVRDLNNRGIVQSGHEVLLSLQNPWDALAVSTLRELSLLFNANHFQAAAIMARESAGKSGGLKPLFMLLASLADGFYSWDNFHYKLARQHLGSAQDTLQKMAAVNAGASLAQLQEHLQSRMAFLDRLVAESREDTGGDATILDIVANAIRRAEEGHHYDDAVARLYSAIEKAAKVRLKEDFGLDNGNLDLEKITDPDLRQELAAKCTDSRDGRVKLPLHRSYSLLQHLGSPLGEHYAKQEKRLRNLLNIRNDSLLAHGFKPVSNKTFADMLDLTLEFLQITRNDLPQFPRLDGEGLGMAIW